MSETTGVTLDDVKHVDDLANLELTAEELPRMARDLNAILGHIAELSELDTTGIEPMAQVSQALGLAPAQSGETLRPDAVTSCLSRNVIMEEAPDTDGRFFKVPKVIER